MKLYVGNLSFDTQDESLRAAFAAYGEVASASVITDRFTGRSRGFGFVEMANDNEGRTAMQALDGSSLDGRSLTVNEAREQQRSSSPRPGGGGGRPDGNRRW